MSDKTIIFLILLLCNILSMNTTFAKTPAINTIIFFGDSLSDVGNNTWILIDGAVGAPITNTDDQRHKYLWVNYLVKEKLASRVYPSSQLTLNPFNHNTSYAYASADTSNHYLNTDWPQKNTSAPAVNPRCTQPGIIKNAAGSITSTCVPGLLRQIDAYLANVHDKPNPKSLFFIWAGANDLLNYYTAYMSHGFMQKLFVEHLSLPTKDASDQVTQQAVNNITAAKKKLIDAGVKKEMIYILDLPDLSRTPAVSTNHSWSFLLLKTLYGKRNIENSIRMLSLDFNKKLHAQKNEKKYSILPTHYVQIENWFIDLIEKPGQYHLTNINDSCVAKKATPFCSGYLFYNKRHPTTWVNKIIAEKIGKIL